MNQELFYLMAAHDNDDLPDGAWWQVLEDAVYYWNRQHGTCLNLNETVHTYLKEMEKKKE